MEVGPHSHQEARNLHGIEAIDPQADRGLLVTAAALGQDRDPLRPRTWRSLENGPRSWHRALAILRILAGEDCNGSSKDGVIGDALDAFGLGCSQAMLRACLDRLERSGLVTLTSLDALVVVRLTRDGAEVAAGKARAAGV